MQSNPFSVFANVRPPNYTADGPSLADVSNRLGHLNIAHGHGQTSVSGATAEARNNSLHQHAHNEHNIARDNAVLNRIARDQYNIFQQTDNDLERLRRQIPGADIAGAKYDPGHTCLSGTRVSLLQNINKWALNPFRTKSLLWLSGVAGSGKSSVANSIAEYLDTQGLLGASFRFSRYVDMRNSPKYLFGNLSFQLASFANEMQKQALASLHLWPNSTLHYQAKIMVGIATALQKQKCVIIIDALDEAGDSDERGPLLNLFANQLTALPSNFCIIITSRPEKDITSVLIKVADIYQVDREADVVEDIALYIDHCFNDIRRTHNKPESWPADEQFHEFKSRANGLFQWAAAACAFILKSHDAIQALRAILTSTAGNSQYNGLMELYSQIFGNILKESSISDQIITIQIIKIIIILQDPLTERQLNGLLCLDDSDTVQSIQLSNGAVLNLSSTQGVLQQLQSILLVDMPNREMPIRIIHPSLYDFFVNTSDEEIRVVPDKQHDVLACVCLMKMNKALKENILELTHPLLFNYYKPRFEGFTEKFSQKLFDGLHYACVHFITHLSNCNMPTDFLLEQLDDFMSYHLLHWIETMSWLYSLETACEDLINMQVWLEKQHFSKKVDWIKLCNDARQLCIIFFHAIDISPVHVYYSALPMLPLSHPLYKNNSSLVKDKFPRVHSTITLLDQNRTISQDLYALERVEGRFWDIRGITTFAMQCNGHNKAVSTIQFSSDGQMLASASWDHTVRLWDVKTGMAIGEPLEGCTFAVSLAFSPNGQILASASRSGRIHLWNVKSGEHIGKLLTSHTLPPTKITFSPNGKILASASYDNTVILWDMENGKPLGDPLVGHTTWVMSVAFSNNGKLLASMSQDEMIRLWDVETGDSVGDPLQITNNHSISIDKKSFASDQLAAYVRFHPNDKQVACIFKDGGSYIWDVQTGICTFSQPPAKSYLPKPVTISMPSRDKVPDEVIDYQSNTLSAYSSTTVMDPKYDQFDDFGFITTRENAMLWLPYCLRGYAIAHNESHIAIGSLMGHITIITP